ncbi:MAG: hypothetical protein JXR73_14740 [Candidatus Omnitrophica bacterium]|nr:hypothetical protein [Candidatus Omnitrophota bacterium]
MNRKFHLYQFLFLFFLCLSSQNSVQGGGPLFVEDGQPVLWPENQVPIEYHVDPGDLGPFSQEEAARLIESSFSAWQSVSSASIRFQRGADLPDDVDSFNSYYYLNSDQEGMNPIIFDHDGAIVQSLYGRGAEDYYLGFSGSTLDRNRIVSSYVLLNGHIIQRYDLSADAVFSTVLHELGHFAGLDHSQLFRHLAENGVGWDDVFVPIMLPTASDDDSFHIQITREDALSLSALYPNPEFLSQTGSIRGVVVRGSNELPGVNIVARRIGSATDHVYSTVSGTYSNYGGDFEFQGLPAGSYRIAAEPIDPAYTGASAVGQYSYYGFDLSFVNPPPMQFYCADPSCRSRSAWTAVSVSAGEAVEDIEIAVSSFNSPDDEAQSVLLAYNQPEIGSLPAYGQLFYQFLLVAGGDEGAVKIEAFSDDPAAAFELHVSRNQRVPYSSDPLAVSQNGAATVRVADGGDLPLLEDRYFIDIRSLTNQELTFEIQSSIVLAPPPTASPTPSPTSSPPRPTPTAVLVNPDLGLVVLDEIGGVYPRGKAVDNFDIGVSRIGGEIIEDSTLDGIVDAAALSPLLILDSGFYPIAKDMEFTGEIGSARNGSEGVYFLLGGNVDNLPPVMGRLGAVGGVNQGGIDADNDPSNNYSFNRFSGDWISIQKHAVDGKTIFNAPLVDIEPAGNNGFYVLNRSGRIYAEGDALESLDENSPPSGWNPESTAVDLEIYRGRQVDLGNSLHSADLIGRGAYILDRLGVIARIGDAPLVNTQNLPVISADSSIFYSDMEWLPDPSGGELIGLSVLRGDGILFFAPFLDVELTDEIQSYIQSLNPFGLQSYGFGFDIARDFEIEISDSPLYGVDEQGETITVTGRRIGLFIMDGFGGIHAGGQSTRYIPMYGVSGVGLRVIQGIPAAPMPVNIPYFGVDVVKDLEITPLINRSEEAYYSQ